MTFIIVYHCYLNWKNDRSPVNIALFILMIFNAIRLFLEIGSEISYYITGNHIIFIVYNFNFNILFLVFAGGFYLSFLLYLFQFRKWYSFPPTTSFFLVIYYVHSQNQFPIEVFVLFSVVFTCVILFINGIRNRQSVSFCLSGSAFFFILGDIFGNIAIYYFLMKFIGSIILYLGTSGWWETHVFFDREYRHKIRSRWVFKFLSKNK